MGPTDIEDSEMDSSPFLSNDNPADKSEGETETAENRRQDSASPQQQDDFEILLDTIGGHGPFQVFIWLVTFGSKMCVANVILLMAFAGATPDFWCLSASATNGSDVISNEAEVTENVLFGNETNGVFKACEANGSACQSFVFEDSLNTIVNEWELVCNKKWASSTITSVQMFGVLVGAATAGQVADMWGRRTTSMALLLGQIVTSLVSAFSPGWIFFTVTRFCVGFCGGGYLVPYFSLALEFTDIRWRALLGALPTWAIGAGLTALAAYILQDWQHLAIFGSVTSFFFLVSWWFMPESVRWLLVHERVKEAQTILERAARWNGTQAPEEAVTRKLVAAEVAKARSQKVYTYRDLFRTRGLGVKSLLLFFVWFSSGTVFYFLAFGAETLSGNLYLNFFLLSTMELPAVLTTGWLNNKLGRRWTGVLMYSLGGLCAIIVVVMIFAGASGSAMNVAIVLSKMFIGGGWAVSLVFTSESFPTVIRNIGYGACNVASRIGAIIAPQLIFLYDAHPSIPYVLVSVLMVGSSLCLLKVPETNDQALEDVLVSAPPGVSNGNMPSSVSASGATHGHYTLSDLTHEDSHGHNSCPNKTSESSNGKMCSPVSESGTIIGKIPSLVSDPVAIHGKSSSPALTTGSFKGMKPSSELGTVDIRV